MNTLIYILIIVSFLAGIYFCIATQSPKFMEGLTNISQPRCPDILVQNGKNYFLYNSKVAKVPGVNPVEFENLEDYVEFVDWQRSQGIRCPVLYLQNTYDTQGNSVYKVRPGPTDLQGGLPPTIPTLPNPTKLIDATRNDMPYNVNSFPAYDQTSFYQGTTTPLDQMNIEQENLLYSPDPMDPNWGGDKYTQSLVDSGYYAGNEVKIAIQ
jgi:hypothetical protein